MGGIGLDAPGNASDRDGWLDQNMHVITHDHPRVKGVQLQGFFAVVQGIGYEPRDTRIA